MTFYTLTKTHDGNGNDYWSLFVLLPTGSHTGKFFYWQHAREFVSRRWPGAAELSEAEMWRETMRREMAVCIG